MLQPNALSGNDASCTAAKGAALLGGVLDVVDACQRLVARGVAATTVEEADLADLVRVREEVGPGDADGVARRCAEVLQRLEELA